MARRTLIFNTAVAVSTTTFDPSKSSANGTLSGGNLIYTNNGGGASPTSITILGVSSSSSNPLWYWELTWNNGGSSPILMFGVQDIASSLNPSFGMGRNGTTSWAYEPDNGFAWYNNGITNLSGLAGTQSPIVTLCVAYNASTGNIWYGFISSGVCKWLNSGGSFGNPATGLSPSATGLPTSTILYPGVSVRVTGCTVTANFGGSPFAGTIPSGFTYPQ